MQHREVTGGVVAVAEKAQAFRMAGGKLGRRLRITAGEQRHVVTLTNQFFRDPRHDALGAAVELRRNSFRERGYLGNAHEDVSCDRVWDVAETNGGRGLSGT
ncbi:hypothetical protein JCM2811A_45450 [Methylorubrum rhodinum]